METALPKEFQILNAQSRRARPERWGFSMGDEGGPKRAYPALGYHITCIPDAVHPWSAHDVSLIRRELDPGFIPIFRRLVYGTPSGGTLTFLHHGIARFDPNALPDPVIAAAPRPYGWKFERPNIIDRWIHPKDYADNRSVRAKYGLPKPFKPWGDWFLEWTRETFWEASVSEKMEWIDSYGADVLAHRVSEFEAAEAAHADREESKYRKREGEKLTPEDLSYVRGVQTGQVQPEPKLSVQIGASL